MILTLVASILGFIAGAVMPLRWGVVGLIGVAAGLFVIQVGVRTAMGFEGTSIEESLLLFNGSWTAFVGFNVQLTQRAFALPLLALAIPLVFRYARRV